jgi:hypothetical protein
VKRNRNLRGGPVLGHVGIVTELDLARLVNERVDFEFDLKGKIREAPKGNWTLRKRRHCRREVDGIGC